MNRDRPQFTLRSFMILIAVVAFVLGCRPLFPRQSIGEMALLGLTIAIVFASTFSASHFLVCKPCFWLIDEARRRSDLRRLARLTAEREP